MEAISLFVVKIILSLYLTVALITLFRVAKELSAVTFTMIREKFKDEVLPEVNENGILAATFIVCLACYCLVVIPIILGYSLYRSISWPVTVIRAIRED